MATAMMVNTTTIAKNKPRMSIGMPLGVMALAAARTDLPERIALKTMSAILNAIESDYYLYSNLMLRSSNSQKNKGFWESPPSAAQGPGQAMPSNGAV
jgi:hypothetical protein